MFNRYCLSVELLIGECFIDELIKGIGVLFRRVLVIYEFWIRDVFKIVGFSIRSLSLNMWKF